MPTEKAQFSTEDLATIVDQAIVEQCACPAQVAQTLLRLRELLSYQHDCLNDRPVHPETHELIGDAVSRCHAILETCLDQVLTAEQWNRATWTMPERLQQRALRMVGQDDGE